MPLPNGDLWPVDERLRNAIETLKSFNKYRDDPMFRPSPVQVAFTVSAAEEALSVVSNMQDFILACYTHVTHVGPTRAELKAICVQADLIKK